MNARSLAGKSVSALSLILSMALFGGVAGCTQSVRENSSGDSVASVAHAPPESAGGSHGAAVPYRAPAVGGWLRNVGDILPDGGTQTAPAASWAASGSMASARSGQTTVALGNGQVLAAGGFGTSASLATSELYDPASSSWAPTGTMSAARYSHTMSRLPNGTVLVTGGWDTADGFRSCEIFNPATGTWRPTADMTVARAEHQVVVLANGKVLALGGVTWSGASIASAEIYDPATETWTATGSMATARGYMTASLLATGKVLVAGSWVPGAASLPTAELYDPATGAWSSTGSMAVGRDSHAAAVLPNGNVLVAGGEDSFPIRNLTSVEIYDASTGTWATAAAMPEGRVYHTLTVLRGGQVLAAGGNTGPAPMTAASSSAMFDPVTGAWTATPSMSTARVFATATVLTNGKVLLAGGNDGAGANYSTTELFSFQ